ncbi:hypothetical protein [Limibacillus halophilus]
MAGRPAGSGQPLPMQQGWIVSVNGKEKMESQEKSAGGTPLQTSVVSLSSTPTLVQSRLAGNIQADMTIQRQPEFPRRSEAQ